jgi:hypothetical protein
MKKGKNKNFLTNFYLNFVNVQRINMWDDHDHMESPLSNTKTNNHRTMLFQTSIYDRKQQI